jgi:hypothetical protein
MAFEEESEVTCSEVVAQKAATSNKEVAEGN